MNSIELIYDADCPNVDASREQIVRALSSTCMPLRWQEWERSAADSPPYVRGFGSPTILVGGHDVAAATGKAAIEGSCCRIYRDSAGRGARAPDVEQIRAALISTGPALPPLPSRPMLGEASTVLPSVGLVLLPKLTCAACWPAYGWLLGAVGLGFFDYTPWVMPLLATFLGLALLSLAYRARARRGYGPLVAGTVAAALMLIDRSAADAGIATYAGTGMLIAASVWNVWPRPRRGAVTPPDGSCSRCPAPSNSP